MIFLSLQTGDDDDDGPNELTDQELFALTFQLLSSNSFWQNESV